MYNVTITTDGSCFGNPGPGGYCAILTCKGRECVVLGNEKQTTNNRMELQALIQAMHALTKPCVISFEVDSRYLITCASHDEAWLTRDNRPNKDLWVEFIKAKKNGGHTVKFVKVKAHSGSPMNERCDRLAKEQAKKARDCDA